MSSEYDMRQMARGTGKSVAFTAGSTVFSKGDAGSCMYVVQSGVVEMVIGDKVIEVVEPNGAIGYMSMIDGHPRSSTARVKENCELTEIARANSVSWSMKSRTSPNTSCRCWRAGSAAWGRRCRPVAAPKVRLL